MGLTVQNEPMANQRWESCIFTAEEERDFIKKYLGPTLQKEGMAGKKLIAWDHNRDQMYQRVPVLSWTIKKPQNISGHYSLVRKHGRQRAMQFWQRKAVSQSFPQEPDLHRRM